MNPPTRCRPLRFCRRSEILRQQSIRFAATKRRRASRKGRSRIILFVPADTSHSARSRRCSRCTRRCAPGAPRAAQALRRAGRAEGRPPCPASSCRPQQQTQKLHNAGRRPRNGALAECDAQRPAPAELALDGRNRGNARRIQQAEHEQAHRRKRCEQRGERRRGAEEHRKRGDDALLRHKTGNQCRGNAPVAETERCKDRRDPAGHHRENTVFGIGDDVEPRVKGLQKPDHDRRDKDDRERALQEVLRLVPEQPAHVLRAGHAVIRQLHHERHRFAAKCRAPQQERRENPDENAGEIKPDHHERRLLREKRLGKKGVNRQLRRAAHERRQEDRHLAVALGGQRTARHNARHRAAEADQHRHDAAAREADLAQQLIHHKRDARHVAAVLEHREKEKQCDDDRQKAQNAADAVENTIDHERMQHRVHAAGHHRVIGEIGQPADTPIEQIGQKCADHVESQPEHERHNGDKGRNGRVFSGQNAVDAHATRMLAALAGLHDRRGADLLNEAEAHVGDRGRAVKPALLLHLADDVLERLLLVLIQPEALEHEAVPLRELARRKTHRDAGLHRVVLDQAHDRVQTAVYRAALFVRIAEIHAAGAFLMLRHVYRVVDQLGDALVFRGGDRHHRDAEHRLHLVDAHRAAVFAHLVHHVEREHHRHVQLHELHRQIQVALDIRRVDDVDDPLRMLLEHKAPRDELLARIRRHRVDARQVGDERVLVPADRAVLAVDRDAREVADVLVRAGELVEKRRLAAVLVTRERKAQRHAAGQRRPAGLHVVPPALAEAGVRDRLFAAAAPAFRCGVPHAHNFDFFRVGQPQRQLVPVDAHLERVAHRGEFHHHDVRARDQPHVEKMLAQRTLAADGLHRGGFSNRKLFQCHFFSPSCLVRTERGTRSPFIHFTC